MGSGGPFASETITWQWVLDVDWDVGKNKSEEKRFAVVWTIYNHIILVLREKEIKKSLLRLLNAPP